MDEVAHAFAVIEGYPQRFRKMQQGEREYFETPRNYPRGTLNFPLSGKPIRQGMQDHQLKELRQRVAESMVRVLSRCHKNGLIDDAELQGFAHKLSLSPEDIKREK
ncbi:hypothetical protein EON81_15300 [bacterium]|nr:MAG: hypothetical protein EON81_15300 [bacterium]